jgi:hypothetical protein
MSPALDAPNTLEKPLAPSPTGAALETLPRARPSCPRERSPLLAWLGCVFMPVPRLRPRQQEACTLGTRRFEAPLDILAREHPAIHLRVMSGIG